MTDTPRRETDERLADWVDGRMSERERERFVAELRVNAQLQRDLEQYERTVGTVRAALRAPTAPSPMADRVLAALAAGREASAAAREPAGWTWRHAWWSIASAAALLACAWWIDSWSQPTPVTTPLAVVEETLARDDYFAHVESGDPASDAPTRRHAYAIAPDAPVQEVTPAAAAPALKKAPGGEAAGKQGDAANARAEGGYKDSETESKKLDEKRVSSAAPNRDGAPSPAPVESGVDTFRKELAPVQGRGGPGSAAPAGPGGSAVGGGGPAVPNGPTTGGPGTFRGDNKQLPPPGAKSAEPSGKPEVAAGDDATLRLRVATEAPTDPAAKAPATPAPDAGAAAALRPAAPQTAPGAAPKDVSEGASKEKDASREGAAKRGELLALVVLEGEIAPARSRDQVASLAAKSAEERARGKDDRKPGEKGEPKSRGAATGNAEGRRELETPLDAAALRQHIDQFLASAADATVEPSALRWVTKTGAVEVSPWLGEVQDLAELADATRLGRVSDLDAARAKANEKQKADAKDGKGKEQEKVEATEEKAKDERTKDSDREQSDREKSDRDKNAAAPIERTWLVEGSKEDVEVLLLRLRAFRDAQHLTMRTGEVAAPTEAWREQPAATDRERQAASTDAPTYGGFARGASAERTRIVLRLRLRAR